MYLLKEINNKNDWNDFIINNDFEFYSFLQSWEWGEIQKSLNKNIIRYGIFIDDIQVGCLQIIKNYAKRGNYYFIPHGPLIIDGNINFFDILSDIKSVIKEQAKKEGFNFIRINSPIKNTIENELYFKKLGFIDSPMHEHAEDTHLLDLTQNEETLLSNIKKDDRYYINRAIKEGVEIIKGNTKEHIEILTKMHTEHSKKVGYTPFSPSFIKNLYKYFSENITTISAKYNNRVESILMTIRFGKTCVYYIASSDIKSHKFSPNYLCQWEAIKDAKQKGCTIYNFWGVSPDDNKNHPIAGVTKFKRKFGGYDYSLLHSQDLILSNKYYFNYLVETFRRIKRGYYYKKPE